MERTKSNISNSRKRPAEYNQTSLQCEDTHLSATLIVEGILIKAVVDSGATNNFIKKEFAERLKKNSIRAVKAVEVVLADGTKKTISMSAKFNITFGNVTTKCIFLVMPDFNEDIVLGLDFLRTFNTTINCAGLSVNCKTKRRRTQEKGTNSREVPNRHRSHLAAANSQPPGIQDELIPSRHTEEEERRIRELLQEELPRFNCLKGLVSHVEHKITMKDNRPFRLHYVQPNPDMQAIIKEDVDKLLTSGYIEVSNSSYCSPIKLVSDDNNETWRTSMDFEELNRRAVRDEYPIPNMNEILKRLRYATYANGLQIQNAYFQIPMAEESKKYTAFAVAGHGLYQWRVMPFGLLSGPATFQRALDMVIGEDMAPHAFAYLDNIFVTGKTLDLQLSNLKEIFRRLRAANIKINPDKCELSHESCTLTFITSAHSPERDGFECDTKNQLIFVRDIEKMNSRTENCTKSFASSTQTQNTNSSCRTACFESSIATETSKQKHGFKDTDNLEVTIQDVHLTITTASSILNLSPVPKPQSVKDNSKNILVKQEPLEEEQMLSTNVPMEILSPSLNEIIASTSSACSQTKKSNELNTNPEYLKDNFPPPQIILPSSPATIKQELPNDLVAKQEYIHEEFCTKEVFLTTDNRVKQEYIEDEYGSDDSMEEFISIDEQNEEIPPEGNDTQNQFVNSYPLAVQENLNTSKHSNNYISDLTISSISVPSITPYELIEDSTIGEPVTDWTPNLHAKIKELLKNKQSGKPLRTRQVVDGKAYRILIGRTGNVRVLTAAVLLNTKQSKQITRSNNNNGSSDNIKTLSSTGRQQIRTSIKEKNLPKSKSVECDSFTHSLTQLSGIPSPLSNSKLMETNNGLVNAEETQNRIQAVQQQKIWKYLPQTIIFSHNTFDEKRMPISKLSPALQTTILESIKKREPHKQIQTKMNVENRSYRIIVNEYGEVRIKLLLSQQIYLSEQQKAKSLNTESKVQNLVKQPNEMSIPSTVKFSHSGTDDKQIPISELSSGLQLVILEAIKKRDPLKRFQLTACVDDQTYRIVVNRLGEVFVRFQQQKQMLQHNIAEKPVADNTDLGYIIQKFMIGEGAFNTASMGSLSTDDHLAIESLLPSKIWFSHNSEPDKKVPIGGLTAFLKIFIADMLKKKDPNTRLEHNLVIDNRPFQIVINKFGDVFVRLWDVNNKNVPTPSLKHEQKSSNTLKSPEVVSTPSTLDKKSRSDENSISQENRIEFIGHHTNEKGEPVPEIFPELEALIKDLLQKKLPGKQLRTYVKLKGHDYRILISRIRSVRVIAQQPRQSNIAELDKNQSVDVTLDVNCPSEIV